MSKYNKALVAVVGVVVQYALQLYGASNPTVQAVVGLLTALGVYGVRNGI